MRPVVEPSDPFDLEIISDGLAAIADEMFVTTARASQSPIIYEVLDFAVGLTDHTGALVTQGNGITMFLATLGDAVASVLRRHGKSIQPGDLYITNDPFDGGGTHLSDVTVVSPIFGDGRLVAFGCNKAHWTEVGGKEPGSVSSDATEVFQEGIQLPCLRLARDDELSGTVLDVIRANVRTPEMSIGDLFAQIASLRLASSRFGELCSRFGTAVVESAIQHVLAHGEAVARSRLHELPKGTFVAEDLIDSDGAGNGPYPVRVSVTITDDGVRCDYTGTHPAVPRPINNSARGLVSAARVVYKALIGPDTPVNDGVFRPLEVICPPGTIFSAESPSPTSAYYEGMAYVADLMWRALAPLVPERLTAGHFLSACAETIAGTNPSTGVPFILYEPNCGGWGAGVGQDGESALTDVGDGETYMIPAEVIEQRYGVFVERFSLNCTDAGAGRWRGGSGIVREYRILSDDATLTASFGRHEYAPWGVDGGLPGSRNEVVVIPADGSPALTAGTFSRYPLRRGDRVRLVTGSGGGWGDPRERDRALIARDLANGYITAEGAAGAYGADEPARKSGRAPDKARSPDRTSTHGGGA